MLHVFLRENISKNANSKFVFRSENAGTFTMDSLLDEMAANNTTVTRADLAAVMNVFKTVLLRYLLLGYTIQTPLGSLYVSAGGTTDDDKASFTPELRSSGHRLHLCFFPTSDVSASVKRLTKFERSSDRLKMVPLIHSVQNGNGKDEIVRGELMRVNGEYLKFDAEYMTQGLFLTKDGVSTRINYYTCNAPGRLDALVPASLEPGYYVLSVAARPNTITYTQDFKTELELL